MTPAYSPRASRLMMGFSMALIGTIGVLRRQIPLASSLLAFVRGILGALSLLLFVALARRRLPRDLGGKTAGLLLLSGAAIGVNWILLFEAFNYTTVATATLCYYTQPTLLMLLSPLLFRERLTVRKLLCAAAAVVGMILVSGVLQGGALGADDRRGILLGLGAAVLYTGVVILNKLTPGVDPYEKTILQLSASALTLLPYLLLTGAFASLTLTPRVTVLLLIAGAVYTGVVYLLYFGSMDALPAQTVALLSYLDPVVALICSWLVLREPVSLSGIVGAALILGAAAVGQKTE